MEDSLVYKVSSKIARSTQRNCISKQKDLCRSVMRPCGHGNALEIAQPELMCGDAGEEREVRVEGSWGDILQAHKSENPTDLFTVLPTVFKVRWRSYGMQRDSSQCTCHTCNTSLVPELGSG